MDLVKVRFSSLTFTQEKKDLDQLYLRGYREVHNGRTNTMCQLVGAHLEKLYKEEDSLFEKYGKRVERFPRLYQTRMSQIRLMKCLDFVHMAWGGRILLYDQEGNKTNIVDYFIADAETLLQTGGFTSAQLDEDHILHPRLRYFVVKFCLALLDLTKENAKWSDEVYYEACRIRQNCSSTNIK